MFLKFQKTFQEYPKYFEYLWNVKESFKCRLKITFVYVVAYSENVPCIFRKILAFSKIPDQVVRESVLNRIFWKTFNVFPPWSPIFGTYFTGKVLLLIFSPR